MSRGRRIALVIALAAYLAVGLVALYVFAPGVVEPKANEELIAAFLDSLHSDSLVHSRKHSNKYDSLQRVWQAERLVREALREHRRDSAKHYWDSVKAVKDSLRAHRDSVYNAHKTDLDHPVNLATANADSLCLVPGIGSVLASRIVDYRDRLGGFVSLRQLLEIEHLSEESLAYFALPVVAVKRLNVNKERPQTLRRHPYISGEQAVAIYEARRKYGAINGWNELMRLPQFTAADKERLEPYLLF